MKAKPVILSSFALNLMACGWVPPVYYATACAPVRNLDSKTRRKLRLRRVR